MAVLHARRCAIGNKLAIAIHVGYQIKHLARTIRADALEAYILHEIYRMVEARAALSFSKSSSAWWEDRVSGVAETIKNPLARAVAA